MLKPRCIARVDMHDGHAVKGRQLEGLRKVAPAYELVTRYAASFDELWIDDVTASFYRRPPRFDVLETITRDCFVPVVYSGGIASCEAVQQALRSGADRVGFCTAAVWDRGFVAEASQAFGASSLVLTLQYKQHSTVLFHGGREIAVNSLDSMVELANKCCSEIMLHSVEREGMRYGYDVKALQRVRDRATVPVSIAGGCRGIEDMFAAFEVGAAGACAASWPLMCHDAISPRAKRAMEAQA